MITKTTLRGAIVSGLLLSTLSAAMATTNAMDMKFAKIAAQGGIFEVKSSQIALQKSQNLQVLSVAKRMVKEHGAANEELKTVAQNNRMTLPADTDPMHKEIIAKPSNAVPAETAQLQLAGLYEATRPEEAKKIYAELKDKDKTGAAGQIAATKLGGPAPARR